MKQSLLLLFLISFNIISFGQTDSLLKALQVDTSSNQQELFPKKMLFTQRILWGENGMMRGSQIVTRAIRQQDLLLRRKMLVTHQVLGFATLGGLIGQAIIGPKLYNDPGNSSLHHAHTALAWGVNTTYSLTAMMSLFSPPPLINRDKGLSSIRLHKWLAVVHMAGMIGTNILASQMENGRNPQLRPYHRAAAYTTFASFAAAMIVIKF